MSDEGRISKRAARLLHADVSEAAIVSEPAWGWPFINLTDLGKNSAWRYAAGISCIILYPIGFSVLVAVFAKDRHLPALSMLIAMMVSINVAGLAVVQAVKLFHKRPPLSVVSPTLTLDWRRLCIGVEVEAAVVTITMIVQPETGGWPWQSTASPSVLIAAFLLIPLQAASEEIVFRGYLTQAFGRVVKSRAVIIIAVGALFALAHWNAYGPLTMPYMFMVSIILSLVSLRDSRLELAIGAHTANNWMSLGTIDTLIAGRHDILVTWLSLSLVIPAGVIFYALSRFAVRDLSFDRPLFRVMLATYVFEPRDRWVRGIGTFAFLTALIMAMRGNLAAAISAVVGGSGWILIYLALARWFWRANSVLMTPRGTPRG